jgi:hypothetical protein
LIDSIERSLFARGVITARIEADEEPFSTRPETVHLLVKSKVLSGMIALIVNLSGDETLTARAEGEEIKVDANDSAKAIAAVHELLSRSGILISTGGADWVI